MDALRFIICGWPTCRRQFLLCSGCDRGQWYCGRACSKAARRRTLREAGRRYQATSAGRRAHAARQTEYRARRAKVTHQTDEEVAAPATVSTAPETAIPAANGGAVKDDIDAKDEKAYGCARCERRSNYVRHQTLAKYRPRWRRPP